MAVRFTGKHAIILSVVVVLVLAVVVALFAKQPSPIQPSQNSQNQPSETPTGDNGGGETPLNRGENTTVSSNATRFVDTISKIASAYNRNDIQKDLEKYSFSPIIFEIDDPKNADIILASLSKEEFQLREVAPTISAISGNATQSAILKLNANLHVINIYYESRGGSLLQNSSLLIGATLVWSLQLASVNITGQNVTVCVVDTGVNYTHPDLGGCPYTSNITSANCSKVIGGKDTVGSGDDNPMDEDPDKHGTHVAGIVAADGGIKGIANGAKLIAVRAWPDASSGTPGDMAQGIQWCIDHKNDFNSPIKIISFSGTPNGNNIYNSTCDTEDLVVKTANNATLAGLVMVAASGNNGSNTSMTSPACGSNVISVGFSDKTGSGSMINISNRNSLTDLFAPGNYINSTNGSNGGYLEKVGTSMAAPHVAGTAALLLQVKSDLTPNQLTDILKTTGINITDTYTDGTNFSRINAYLAVSAVSDSLLRVNTLSLINYSSLSHIIAFTIQNANLSNITNISWSADMGDGIVINSTYNITQLLWKETALVRLKHNYSQNGIYIVNVSTRAGNLFHSKNITVFVGDVILYDLRQINISGRQRMFQFTIRNNKDINLTNLGWNMSFGEGTVVSNSQILTLDNKTDIFFRIKYNYTSASPTGGFRVTANATNVTFTDSKNITVDVI